MDNGPHGENGRPRPPQGQFFLQPQPSMKHIMAIMQERDRAIQERNIAWTEKKTALAERDFAILHRDQAIQDRNSAMMEREHAIATFQYRKNTINSGVEHTYHPPHQHMHHRLHVEEPESELEREHELEPEPEKPKKAKKMKEPKMPGPDKKIVKKKVRKEREENEGGLNEVAYDETMPVPVCSCTGVYRACYKWGSGGWQSSCCTTTISVYPLPQVPGKKHGRIGGRKMSGSAYNKLLRRLAAEGHDLSNPVDLKDNWARHGTNRYITIK